MSGDPCFWEEIGVSLDGKVWETGCGDEETIETVPKFCMKCGRAVEIAPGCRRCGSIEHTTSWHDADASGKEGGTVEIQTLGGGDLLRIILDNQENEP